MAKIRTDKSGLSYRIWKDAEGVTRSRPLGRQPEAVLDLIREAWDDGVAHGRVTQGRSKGKPVVRHEETWSLTPREAIDEYLDDLYKSDASHSTKANTKSALNVLFKKLGNKWRGWTGSKGGTSYYGALDSTDEPNTRGGWRRAANHLCSYHMGDIPDFRVETKWNKPAKRYVKNVKRKKRKKEYDTAETVSLFRTLPTVEMPDYMTPVETVEAFMAMSPEDARNFLTGRTPDGADPTKYDWEERTYFARRQKTLSYYEGVPIPQPVYDLVHPFVAGRYSAPKLPLVAGTQTLRRHHKRLEKAAGVKYIERRCLNGLRHHMLTVLSTKLKAPKAVRKALAAQRYEGREKQDILEGYEHAWLDVMREWSDKFVAYLQDAVAQVESEAA